jgi:hypothetical protein
MLTQNMAKLIITLPEKPFQKWELNLFSQFFFVCFLGLPFCPIFSPTNLNPKPYHHSSYQLVYLPHLTDPPSPTFLLQSLHHQQVECLGLGNLELEEWRAWSLRSRKFESMSLKVNTLFIFYYLFFGFGFGGHHRQLLTKVSSPFFLFLLLLLGMGGCHCQVSAESQTPCFSFFFFYVLLLVGANGLHRQFFAEGEPKLPFFFIYYLWVHVGSIANFQQPKLLFFSFFCVACGCRWVPSPSFGTRGACSPPPFFCWFLGAITKFQ